MTELNHICYLFPCVLVSDFTYEKIASDDETEEADKWSRDEPAGETLTIDFDYTHFWEARRSLKVIYDTTSDGWAVRGKAGETLSETSLNNPYGINSADFDWDELPSDKINVGMWLRCSAHTGNDDSTLLTFQKVTGISSSSVNWNSSVSHTDRWEWWDDQISGLSNVERFRVGFDSSDEAGTIYIDSICLFNKTASNIKANNSSENDTLNDATNEYNWKNGVGLLINNYTRTGSSIDISGIIIGDDFRLVEKQLKSMETKGISSYNPVEGPFPRFNSIRDFGYLKTYLFTSKVSKSNNNGYNTDIDNIPVIITNVSIDHQKKKPGIVPFTMKLIKFSG